MRQIADSCKMSVGNMYNYVKSKEDVLFLAMDNAIRAGQADIKRVSSDPGEALREAIRYAYGNMNKEQNYVLFIYQESKNLPPRYRKRILNLDREYAAKFQELLVDGVQQGVFRADIDPFLVSQNIVTLGHMWCFRRWLLRDRLTFKQYLDRQLDFIVAAVSIQAPRGRAPVAKKANVAK